MGYHTFPLENADALEEPARFRFCSREELLALIDPSPAAVVADLGSGTGFYTDEVAPFVEHCYAVDVQTGMHDRYREIFSGESVDSLAPEQREAMKERAIFGTPEQVVAELETYREALGDDVHVVFRTYHPGTGTDEMRRCIERLGDEVAPELR